MLCPLAHTVKLHYAMCQHCCIKPIIPQFTVQIRSLLLDSILPSVLPSMPQYLTKRFVRYTWNSVQDGSTKLHGTSTNFVPKGREMAELSFRQKVTHLGEHRDRLSRCLNKERSNQSVPCVTVVPFAISLLCLKAQIDDKSMQLFLSASHGSWYSCCTRLSVSSWINLFFSPTLSLPPPLTPALSGLPPH